MTLSAGKAEPPHAFEHHAEPGRIGAGDLDELVVAAQAPRIARRLMHGGGGGMRDRRADRASEELLAGGVSALRHGSLSSLLRAFGPGH